MLSMTNRIGTVNAKELKSMVKESKSKTEQFKCV